MTSDIPDSYMNFENSVDSIPISIKDDSINLYTNIDINCNEYDSIYSWQNIDTIVPNSNKEYMWTTSESININNKNIRQKYTFNKCNTYKSLPNIQLSTKSNKILLLHTSKSLPSCLKFLQEKIPIHKKYLKKNIIEKKKSNPTIGELLGDDDLFHYHYHNKYNSSRSKRERHHHSFSKHRSYSHSSYPNNTHIHNHRKHRRSNYFNTIKESQYQHMPSSSEIIQSMPETSQMFINPTTYSFTPLPAYYYYSYSNMASCCPCLISNSYAGLYQQEIHYETSTSQHHYQQSEKYKKDKYSNYHYHNNKRSK